MRSSKYLIRKATLLDAENIARVHVTSWQTSYTGIIDQDFLDNISYERRLASRKDILKSKNNLHLVALFDEKIIGFADVGPLRPESWVERGPLFNKKKVGEIYAIYLLEEHKRKGLGRAFFEKCRIWLSSHGFDSFVTWVLADNLKARPFYESEGGRLLGEKTIQIGEQSYREICYFFNGE